VGTTGTMQHTEAAGTTMPDLDAGLHSSSRGKWGRRVAVGVITTFVLAGAVGLMGVRTVTTAAQAGEIRAEVRHPGITRPGLAASWSLRISSPDGFDEPITVRQRSRYYNDFDFNGMEPAPASSTSDGGWIEWEWDAPPTTDFLVTVDARVEPGVQWPVTTETVVEAEGEELRLEYETWVLP
jgi:hypothetical protein